MNLLDGDGKRVGTISIQSPTMIAVEVMDNAILEAAMGGGAVRNLPAETFYAQLRRHDPSGDDFYVTFTRTAVETWTDTVPELN